MFQFILLSLLFAFVYWWFIHEGRLERFAFLIWYLVFGVWSLFDLHNAKIMLTALLGVMVVAWFLGFKWGFGVIHEPE